MYNFILEIFIMLGLGTMIYIVARAAPRIEDETAGNSADEKSKFDVLFSYLRVEKFDVIFNNFAEKLLRKLKLLSMRLDNFTNNYLDKVKKLKMNGNNGNGQKNGEGKPTLFENKIETEDNSEK